MSSSQYTPDSAASDVDPFRAQVREATELLERIVSDRGLLATLPREERDRLHRAAGLVYHPDSKARRQMVKATTRQRKAAAVRRDEAVLEERGIRSLRRQSVFNTPNIFPPERFEQSDVDDPDFRETVEEQHCYVCKQK